MLHPARMGCAARLAAALVAVTLSGAPRVLALHAPIEGHRCSCKAQAHGQRECDCAICRKAALSARAADERVPPCHRGAERRPLPRDGADGSPGVPCVERTCGGEGRAAMTVAGVEPFCLPAERPSALALSSEARPILAAPVRERSLQPETPPPRAG